MTEPLSLCQVVPCINEQIGGPAYSVTRLAAELAKRGHKTNLCVLHYPEHGKQCDSKPAVCHRIEVSTVGRLLRGYQSSYRKMLGEVAQDAQLIHNHGLWMAPNYFARQMANRYGLPLITSLRGMVEPWSLLRSVFRKHLAWWWYERRNLHSAALLHATSEQEAQAIRELGLTQPIVVIPNGVDLPAKEAVPKREVLETSFPELREKRWLLFLSRLDPKKGLDTLMNLWRDLHRQYPEWVLLIAGPDLVGLQSQLQQRVGEYGLEKQVYFLGMLSGDNKASALSGADLFILPTHSENFGVVVAEALAHGTPVITTHPAPWSILEKEKCGWWVSDDSSAVGSALEHALSMSREELNEMGGKGREVVKREYSWPVIAQQMEQAYRWILNKGDVPEKVWLCK